MITMRSPLNADPLAFRQLIPPFVKAWSDQSTPANVSPQECFASIVLRPLPHKSLCHLQWAYPDHGSGASVEKKHFQKWLRQGNFKYHRQSCVWIYPSVWLPSNLLPVDPSLETSGAWTSTIKTQTCSAFKTVRLEHCPKTTPKLSQLFPKNKRKPSQFSQKLSQFPEPVSHKIGCRFPNSTADSPQIQPDVLKVKLLQSGGQFSHNPFRCSEVPFMIFTKTILVFCNQNWHVWTHIWALKAQVSVCEWIEWYWKYANIACQAQLLRTPSHVSKLRYTGLRQNCNLAKTKNDYNIYMCVCVWISKCSFWSNCRSTKGRQVNFRKLHPKPLANICHTEAHRLQVATAFCTRGFNAGTSRLVSRFLESLFQCIEISEGIWHVNIQPSF